MKHKPTRYNAQMIRNGKVIKQASKVFDDPHTAYKDAHADISAFSGDWVEVKPVSKPK